MADSEKGKPRNVPATTGKKNTDPAKVKDYDPGRRPWEKQPWETGPAFAAFAIFRDLGPMRSIRKAVTAYMEEGDEHAKSRNPDTVNSSFAKWSAGNRWQDRAEAYTLEQDERHRLQREGEVARMRRRYQAGAGTASAAIIARLAGGGATLKPLDVNELDFEGAIRALATLQKIEYAATGTPTDVVKGSFLITSHDMERISRDLVEIALPFIPLERQPLYAQAIQSYATSGKPPTP